MERGAVDQHVNELVNDLASRFERCQQLLNNITVTANSKPMVRKLNLYFDHIVEERDLLLKYKTMVEQAVNPDQ
ncbi:hypothetical protein AXG93_3128s1110 [Marchantia polymorpha subsp. ruderalis]|uniref:Uncharacterized protein n=1 Tax=Marchantia polymorpha subsp. ruderalis TaxID=1480154 RepID=A0A176WEY7_MARPO|nr:hypothetical protein AXG93_3128s1110 [Marchantia polymorpha subsp. ruderalis]